MKQFVVRVAFAAILAILPGAVVPGMLLAAEEKAVASAAHREIVLEDFQADRGYPPDFFRVDPQPRYRVLDSVRGIRYTAGESRSRFPSCSRQPKRRRHFWKK